jgi:hypothetical protein
MNKRIGSMQTGKVSASKSRTALSQTVMPHCKKPTLGQAHLVFAETQSQR